jgi:hypothetical protein
MPVLVAYSVYVQDEQVLTTKSYQAHGLQYHTLKRVMVALPGRGFDSRQLHQESNDSHPRKGVFCL